MSGRSGRRRHRRRNASPVMPGQVPSRASRSAPSSSDTSPDDSELVESKADRTGHRARILRQIESDLGRENLTVQIMGEYVRDQRSWVEKHANALNIGLSVFNVVTSILVSNSDIFYRSMVITGGGLAQWLLRLESLYDRNESQHMQRKGLSLTIGMIYMISAYPACVYPFVSDSGHSDKEKIYSSLSFLIPFLIERGVYCSFLPNDSKKKYEVTVRPWRYFFFERSQAISKIGGVVDLLFNNILASLWMSSAKLSGRFFATGPNLVLTALVGIAKLRQLEGVLKKDYSTSSDHVPWYYDASKYMALIASSGITAFLMTVMYSLFAESEEVLALESNSTFGIQLLLSSTAFFLIQKLNWEIIKLSYKKFSDLQLLRPIRVEIELGNRVQPQEIQSEIKDFRAFESSLDIEWVEGDVEVSATPAQSSVSRQTSTGLLARLQSGVTFGLSLFQCGRRQRVRPPDVSARDLS